MAISNRRSINNFIALTIASLPALTSAPACAQCDPAWLAIPGAPSGQVFDSIVWDPDGAGPLTPRLVVSGAFRTIGVQGAGALRSWDGETWTSMDANLAVPTQITSLAVDADGGLVIGGDVWLTVDSENQFAGVARWNGSGWTRLGEGLTPSVYALLARADGTLVAAGNFGFTAEGTIMRGIAQWDGESWTQLGLGAPGLSPVYALAETPSGDLVAGGSFNSMGGTPAKNIALWNGAAWSALGEGVVGGASYVYTIAAASDGSILAGGTFAPSGEVPARSLVRWDGAAWSSLAATQPQSEVQDMLRLPDGSLIVGGSFTTINGVDAARIARFHNNVWSSLGADIAEAGSVYTLSLWGDGSIIAGGYLPGLSPTATPMVAWFGERCDCPADLDNDGDFTNGPTRDNAVTIDDLLYFLVGFEEGSDLVDLDNGTGTGTPDGGVTIDDLLYFLIRFGAGC